MILKRFTFFLTIIFFYLISPATAQIAPDLTGVNDNFFQVDSTQYINNAVLGRDPIYIYYSKDDGYSNLALLKVGFKDSTNLNFKWFLYNELTHKFDSLLKEDLNMTISSRSQCTQGGYKIEISSTKSDWDTAFYCWVFQNEFNISAIRVNYSECDFMQLRSFYNYNSEFNYYDRLSGELLKFEIPINKLIFDWKADPDYGVEIEHSPVPTFEAPTKPTVYRLTITDYYKKYKTKKIEINEGDHNGDGNLYLKAVKAKFSASRRFIPEDESDSTGQAPLMVQFVDSSENAYDYEWCFFRQGIKRNTSDSLLYKVVNTRLIPDSIRYTQPGDKKLSNGADNPNSTLTGYDVALEVKGPKYKIDGVEYQCVDRMLKKEYIQVTPTFVLDDNAIPNVFTPGGAHPIFNFSKDSMPESVKYFSVKIYNRWGNKIYEYEDRSGEWPGWDGETRGFGSAPTGVYYYVIIYDGWNGEKRRVRKGFVHLFRPD